MVQRTTCTQWCRLCDMQQNNSTDMYFESIVVHNGSKHCFHLIRLITRIHYQFVLSVHSDTQYPMMFAHAVLV